MEEDKSFFAHLFNLKYPKNLEDEKRSEENNDNERNDRQNENEWLQEYKLIYHSYAIER